MECWYNSKHVDVVIYEHFLRLHPPRVKIDNTSNKEATLIQVDSANKRGSLLNVVQVLTNLDLIIKRAYITSDGEWFMDVFHVTDTLGNKVYDDTISEQIQQSLRPREESFKTMANYVDIQPSEKHTIIELSTTDRTGLLSDIFAILTDLKCNVLTAQVWTHNSRMASFVYITDESNMMPIDDPKRIGSIKERLLCVLKGNRDEQHAEIPVVIDSTHTERRSHQIISDDRDYDIVHSECENNEHRKPLVTIEDCAEKNYSVLHINCPNRPMLFYDTVCTITDMQYVIFHGTITTEGPVAQQEYFIKRMDGSSISSKLEKEHVIDCLEAAIKRMSYEGIRLDICSTDRIGLLSNVTRIFRENGLTVKRAKIRTKGAQALNVFYVADISGYPVRSETFEEIQKEVGFNGLNVMDETFFT